MALGEGNPGLHSGQQPGLEESTRSFDSALGDWSSAQPDIPTRTRSEGDSREPDVHFDLGDNSWERDLRDRLKLTGYSDPRLIVDPLPGRRIFLSRHIDLDRTVAVKVFLPIPGVRRPWLDAFKREARAAARVDHPLVLRLHTGGQLAGCAFLIYDFCEGGSLTDRLRVGQPSLAYALRIALRGGGHDAC